MSNFEENEQKPIQRQQKLGEMLILSPKPPVRIELTTPGLQDQCSTTELWRLLLQMCEICTDKGRSFLLQVKKENLTKTSKFSQVYGIV